MICITVVKLSILFFYRHIFSVAVFLRINWGLMAVCATWGIITTFLVIFQCSPVHGLWHYEMQFSGQATCINASKMIFGFEVTNVVIDVMVLLPPVVMVQRLKLKAAKRAFVTGIILLGLLWVPILLILILLAGRISSAYAANPSQCLCYLHRAGTFYLEPCHGPGA